MIKLTADISLRTDKGLTSGYLSGSGDPDSGFIAVSIELAKDGRTVLDPVLATAYTITGCPRFARVHGAATNLWLQTGGSYACIRDVTFDSGKQLSSRLFARREGESIHMDLKIWGNVDDTPTLAGVDRPFQERFDPAGAGRIEGSFDVDFRTVEGGLLHARARTIYALDTVSTLPRTHFRNIVLDVAVDKDSLAQREFISLFDDEQAAREQLASLRKLSSNGERFGWLAA
jgi:hypothetical protein